MTAAFYEPHADDTHCCGDCCNDCGDPCECDTDCAQTQADSELCDCGCPTCWWGDPYDIPNLRPIEDVPDPAGVLS